MAATNKDLGLMISENKFREDLYYRLKVLEIKMPSLRERPEDIPQYIRGLLLNINKKVGSDAVGLTAESIEILKAYDWPGNVRQLENFLEQAVNYSDEAIIDVTKLDINPWESNKDLKLNNSINPTEKEHVEIQDFNHTIYKTEKDIIIEAIKECNGNKSNAAKVLNINRSVLYKKIKRLNIEK